MSKDVEIQKASFRLCRVSLTILLWLAVITKSQALLLLVFVLLALSSALGVQRAPLVALGDRIFRKGQTVLLNIDGMRFAHGLGAAFALTCLVLLWNGNSSGWTAASIFAIFKTSSMLGFCPAERAYRCMTEGGCCSFARKIKKCSS